MTAAAPPRTRAATARSGTLAGTGTLIAFILRRDRVRLPVWLGAITLSIVAMAASFPGLYRSAEERQARAQLMGSPTAAAFTGPGHGLDDYTFGAMLAHELLGFVAVVVALMSLLLVVRHTRAEEESGRAELVRSQVVGRHATNAAAVVVVGGANVVLAVAVGVGLGALGVESIDWAGSLLFGASLGAVGLVFTGVAAVTAQLTEHSRGAAGMAGAVLGLVYVLRAVGDMADNPTSWLSPIGWVQQTRVYVDDRWWPLTLALLAFAVLAAVAMAASDRRDVGAGMRQARPGRAEASTLLATPLGFAARLQGTAMLWWTVGLLLFGFTYGSFVGEAESFIAELDIAEDFLPIVAGAALIDAFFAMVLSMLGLVAAVAVGMATLRARTEEADGRAEPILATAVSRTGWVSSHLAVALVGGPLALLAGALGLGASAAIALEDADVLPRLLGAALAYVPALWFVAGLAVALFGFLPRAVAAVWVLVGYAAAVGLFGGLLGLPDWMFELSPFEHVAAVPAEDLAAAPLVVLTVLAAVLVAAGLAGFERRDLEGS